MAEHNYLRKSKKARKACIGILFTLLIQLLMAEISDFWQMGTCTGNCFWKEGLPWTPAANNGSGNWIFTLFLGIFAMVLVLLAWVMLLVEMCCAKHLQDSGTYNWCLWAFCIVALISWILHWILYLVFKWPLLGTLSFCFVSAILSTAILIIVCVVLYFGLKWRRLANPDGKKVTLKDN